MIRQEKNIKDCRKMQHCGHVLHFLQDLSISHFHFRDTTSRCEWVFIIATLSKNYIIKKRFVLFLNIHSALKIPKLQKHEILSAFYSSRNDKKQKFSPRTLIWRWSSTLYLLVKYKVSVDELIRIHQKAKDSLSGVIISA